jgi:hypothetical protein
MGAAAGLRLGLQRTGHILSKVRFDVNKRALMLTVATAALVGTPAYAATVTGCDSNNTVNYTDIATKVTVPLCTSFANKGAAGNIIVDVDGSVEVSGPTGSTTTVTPAVTINSNNIVTNKTQIQFTNVTSAIGVQLDSGNSGALDNIGTIDLNGSGTTKTGILITTLTGATSTTFTGVPLPDSPAATPPTRPTAIDLESGSILEVQGDSSFGIDLATNTNLAGDILIGGSLSVTPTTAGETTGTGGTGVEILGNMTGNFTVESGGVIDATGPSSQGVLLSGTLTGAFTNDGTIEAVGTNTPSTTKANAQSGSALWIENNITGGIYNGGRDISSDTTTATAVISASGLISTPTIFVAPLPGATTPLVIGAAVDPDAVATDAGFGLLNRGDITGAATNSDVGVTTIRFAGVSSTANVVLTGGILNAGSITATGTTTVASLTTPIAVSSIIVDDYASVPEIVTSNESGGGTISATVGGAGEGVATAILVNATDTASGENGLVTQIVNAGSILASATTTDNTIGELQAYAIRDLAGTITSIYNSGSISAIVTPLTDGLQVATAADLSHSSSNITFMNSGTVTGDVFFGTGNDTFTVQGLPSSTAATMIGNINFGGTLGTGVDTLMIGGNDEADSVSGQVQEQGAGSVAVTVNSDASLYLKNNGLQSDGEPILQGSAVTTNLPVNSLTVDYKGTLGLTLAQAFNFQATLPALSAPVSPIVQLLPGSSGNINIMSGAIMNVTFGAFVTATNATGASESGPSEFVLLDAPAGKLTIASPSQIVNDIVGANAVPFLFTGAVCGYNLPGFTGTATSTTPNCAALSGVTDEEGTDSQLVLALTPKTVGPRPGQLPLTGYAQKMFPLANAALANDNALGAAVIAAGAGITNAAVGNALYQQIYSAFAPDVTGAIRAEAISLTDQATGPVGARQRALRMYAGQDGEATLWGQEFGERLQVGNQISAGGYNDSGFGFVLGMDAGDPADGRYGGAFTFFSGDADEKAPRDSKTTSQWYMATGYTDWRGKGLFLDSQLTVGYGDLEGKRFFDFGGVSRTADGKRASALLAGGATAGVALTTGGTVLMPQISVDGLTMREEAYSETNGGATTSTADDGFDLHVHQTYEQSLRGFAGFDVRQDLNFGGFFLQPEARFGYRYDLVDGMEKLKAEFVSVPSSTFTITGPDPARGNLIAGGGLATTTGAWSIGVNYDYVRGIGTPLAKDTISQSGTLTLLGRI